MLEDMLRGCVIEFSGSWDRYIPLMEFAYNNSFQSNISMAPYEALYGRKCRTPVCWTDLNEHKLIGPDLVKDTEEKVQVIRQRLKAASDRQKSYANLKRRDIEYNVGDEVFLKVSLSCPKSRSDPIGGSEPVSGCETQDWDSLPDFFF